jgi:hypothetical protein
MQAATSPVIKVLQILFPQKYDSLANVSKFEI